MPDTAPVLTAHADRAFAAIQAAYGSHPDFQANSRPIRDAIAAFLANPKAAVPVLSVIGAFLPPQGQTIVNGIIGLLNVMPSQAAPAMAPVPAGPNSDAGPGAWPRRWRSKRTPRLRCSCSCSD